MRKIKAKDKIVVIAGKDKNKTGEVTRVLANDRVIVAGINVAKKHQRGNPQKGVQSGIVDKEMPIHISNVALYNPLTKKADRVGIKILENGKKVRYFKSNNEMIDV